MHAVSIHPSPAHSRNPGGDGLFTTIGLSERLDYPRSGNAHATTPAVRHPSLRADPAHHDDTEN